MSRRPLNRRRFLQISMTTAAGTILVACGQEPASTAPAGSAAGAAASTAPAASAAGASAAPVAAGGPESYKGEIEFWDWSFDRRQAAEDALIEEWKTKYPELTIKYTAQGYDDTQTKLLTAGAAGQGPPFANVHFNWRVDLQRAGVLAPYPDDLFDYSKLISTPFNRDPNTGKLYTSSFALYTDQVYFWTPMLEEQGIKADQIPRKWEDFMKMAEQLTVRDANGKLQRAGWTFNHYYSREWLWASLVYQQGGWLYSEDGTQALWNSDEAVQALQLIQDVYHKHKVDDVDSLGMFDAWGTDKAAMYISQGYTGAGHNTNYPDKIGQWGTAVTPTFTGEATPAWGLLTPEEGFCVFTSAPAEVQQVAFQFIKELIGTDEKRVDWALISNGPPDDQQLFEDSRLQSEDPGRSISTQAETLPYRINYGERPLEAEKIWRAMFDETVLTPGDVKAALDKATEQMNAALKESGKQRLFTERAYKPPA